MVKYVAVVSALVAYQGAAALQTRVFPIMQNVAPDVCHPQGPVTFDKVAPPCLSQSEVEGQCAQTSQDEAGWALQRDCMCKGSFIEDAFGCLACKKRYGINGHKETEHWRTVFSDIKDKYCDGPTPTAKFGAYWTAALKVHGSPVATPGDQRDGVAKNVESYYMPTKSQGPGIIIHTGSVPAHATGVVASAAAPAKATGAAAAAAEVKVYAAATVRYAPAVISAAPVAPKGRTFANATGADVDVKAVYALASVLCEASYAKGSLQTSCGAYEIVANSEVMVSVEMRPAAVDFSACTCVVDYLAAKRLRPVATVSAASTVAFSPQECVGPCSVPAPAKEGKTPDSCFEEECATGGSNSGASPSRDEASGEELPEDSSSVPSQEASPVGQGSASPAGQAKPAPLGTGAPASGSDFLVKAGAGRTGVSAAVLAIAAAVAAL